MVGHVCMLVAPAARAMGCWECGCNPCDMCSLPCSVLHWFPGFVPGGIIWFASAFTDVLKTSQHTTQPRMHCMQVLRPAASGAAAARLFLSRILSFLLASTAEVLCYATAGWCPGIGSCLKYTAGRSHLAVTYIHGHLTCFNCARVYLQPRLHTQLRQQQQRH